MKDQKDFLETVCPSPTWGDSYLGVIQKPRWLGRGWGLVSLIYVGKKLTIHEGGLCDQKFTKNCPRGLWMTPWFISSLLTLVCLWWLAGMYRVEHPNPDFHCTVHSTMRVRIWVRHPVNNEVVTFILNIQWLKASHAIFKVPHSI